MLWTLIIPDTVKEMVGVRYKYWTVLGFAGYRLQGTKQFRVALCRCRCVCGTVKSLIAYHLRQGSYRSCGCKRNKHGMARSPEYKVWERIIQRCHNPSATGYHNYGGRGIAVCKEWRKSFESFYSEIGKRPSDKHTIDRIDNERNYEPGNVRWATRKQQAQNRRTTHRLSYNGHILSITELAKMVGVKHETIRGRLRRGLSLEEAIKRV